MKPYSLPRPQSSYWEGVPQPIEESVQEDESVSKQLIDELLFIEADDKAKKKPDKDEKVKTIIAKLDREKYGNADQRKAFVSMLNYLNSLDTAESRSVIKHLGAAMTGYTKPGEGDKGDKGEGKKETDFLTPISNDFTDAERVELTEMNQYDVIYFDGIGLSERERDLGSIQRALGKIAQVFSSKLGGAYKIWDTQTWSAGGKMKGTRKGARTKMGFQAGSDVMYRAILRGNKLDVIHLFFSEPTGGQFLGVAYATASNPKQAYLVKREDGSPFGVGKILGLELKNIALALKAKKGAPGSELEVGTVGMKVIASPPTASEIKAQKILDKWNAGADTLKEKVEKTKQLVHLLVKKAIKGFILSGHGGVGKSFVVKTELENLIGPRGSAWRLLKGGNLTPSMLISIIKQDPTGIYVLDDVDSYMKHDMAPQQIKGALDTTPPRMIIGPGAKRGGEPEEIEFTGGLIVISNMSKAEIAKNIDAAALTRIPTLVFDVDLQEILDYMEEILLHIDPSIPVAMLRDAEKQDIFDFFKSDIMPIIRGSGQALSIRSLVQLMDLYVAEPNSWKATAVGLIPLMGI